MFLDKKTREISWKTTANNIKNQLKNFYSVYPTLSSLEIASYRRKPE